MCAWASRGGCGVCGPLIISTHPSTQTFDHYFGAEGIKTGDVIAFVWVKDGLLTDINGKVREGTSRLASTTLRSPTHKQLTPINPTPHTNHKLNPSGRLLPPRAGPGARGVPGVPRRPACLAGRQGAAGLGGAEGAQGARAEGGGGSCRDGEVMSVL